MRKSVRCVATNNSDGTRCGRRARPGSNPQLCSMHDGSVISPVMPDPAWFNEMDILRKLSKDKDPRVRLRACDLLLSRADKETECIACAARSERETKHAQFIETATYEQVEQVRDLVNQIRRLMGDKRELPGPRRWLPT